MPYNDPGRWKYFLSHVQRECKLEAVELAHAWGKEHCWLDRYMEDKSVAAMEEGVKGSETFVVILSEGYFNSEYCCSEMRWALETEKPIISTYKSGANVGAILNTAPDDFRERIKAIDSIKLDADDSGFFAVCMSKITKRLSKLSAGDPTKLCDIMISYTQKNANAKALALNLYSELEKHGYKVWLDVKVDDKSEAAMQKAVNTSKFVIAILCDGQGVQECAYFERPFCLKELRWAKQANTFIQPVVMDEDITRIDVLLSGGTYPDTTRFGGAPKDLRDLGSVEMIGFNMSDPEYFTLGLMKLIRKVRANGVEIDDHIAF
uniref:TIR domain-containing protein n=1 Tax=Phaeocystis antarctica TaxID=33657 RepID=A0A7S0ESX1_9EUKA|mmetsp:Transcript_30401/g.71633  ORF Transcript_30401/g.71633 Transcript_30401/m.71633 type:complete len:320 (+) Transcript_30401:61-1020(+)